MNQEILLTSIFTYISTITDLPDIFYPNTNQTTIPDEYLQINVMPTIPNDIGLKEIKQNFGLIQISVVTRANVGEIKAAKIVDKILEAFKRNTVIPTSKIRIDNTPYASQGMNIDSYYMIPITISYNKLTV